MNKNDKKDQLVFTYGSLMTGLGNHHYLESSDLIGPAKALSDYRMISYDAYPAVYWHEEGQPVVGELYVVSYDTLRALDQLESNGYFYKREYADVSCEGWTMSAWMYLLLPRYRNPELPIVESNDWREFQKLN